MILRNTISNFSTCPQSGKNITNGSQPSILNFKPKVEVATALFGIAKSNLIEQAGYEVGYATGPHKKRREGTRPNLESFASLHGKDNRHMVFSKDDGEDPAMDRTKTLLDTYGVRNKSKRRSVFAHGRRPDEVQQKKEGVVKIKDKDKIIEYSPLEFSVAVKNKLPSPASSRGSSIEIGVCNSTIKGANGGPSIAQSLANMTRRNVHAPSHGPSVLRTDKKTMQATIVPQDPTAYMQVFKPARK